MFDQIVVFGKLLNLVDQAIICVFIISMLIAARLGLKRELLLMIVIALPTSAVAFIPTGLIEEYLSEVIVSKKMVKLLAPSVIYTVFLFISIIIKRSIESEHVVRGGTFSLDFIGGLIFGFVRSFVILLSIMIAHAHFFSQPIQEVQESLIITYTKSLLTRFDGRFEDLLTHKKKIEEEIAEDFSKARGGRKKRNTDLSKKQREHLESVKVVDIDADESNPEIRP